MPPKKVAKKRVPKPTIKRPLKIPTKNTMKIGSSGSKSPKVVKNITSQRKIELANEVALAQLQAQSCLTSPKPAATPTQAYTPETVKKPVKKICLGKRKITNVTTDADSIDDFETAPELKKRRPGPKSKTMPQMKKKPDLNPLVLVSNSLCDVKEIIAKPTNTKKTPNRKKQLKSTNLCDVLNKEGTLKACMNVAAIPPSKPRGRPKGSGSKCTEKTPTKVKCLNAKEIKAAATMLEKALGITSQPNSRPNSVISNKSNLSWTKDISTESSFSSGTTTCVTVTSNDFVRFNNKLPVVQMENCELPKVNNVKTTHLPPSVISKDDSSSSDSDSSSTSSSDSELDETNSKPELNLSTSSLTPKSPLSDTTTDPFSQGIENLNNLLKNFYSEIGKLVPHCDDHPCTFSDIMEGADHDISMLLNKCDNFDRDLEAMFQENNSPGKSVERNRTADFSEQNESDHRSLEDSRRPSCEDNHSETSSRPERYRQRHKSIQNEFEAKSTKPCMVRSVSAANTPDTSTSLPDKKEVSNHNRLEASPTDSFKSFTSDYYNYVPFDRTNDDEDALSLYAESITGVESSRLDSVSNVSLQDVYIPKYSPISYMREKYVYKPTKIQKLAEGSIEEGEIISHTDDQDHAVNEPNTKCNEISRACVSSSGSADMNKTALELLQESNRISSIAEGSIKRAEAQISSQPRRLFSSYKPMNPIKSSLYRGFCFFHIASQCKNISCRFSHAYIDPNTFKSRLSILNEDNLIAEYLLMCVHLALRRNFCLLFVEECKRRKATRILFEMAIDFGLRVVETDEDLSVKVLETALLHLNTISLDACDDLLKFEHKNIMMCDALLSCMANSQNFAQFKRAFVKLTNLMRELNRPVDIEVASSILERVCILPGEDILARGMLSLMENTDVSIFENCLAESFEVQLSNIDSDVHEVYLVAKRAALGDRFAQPDEIVSATSLLIPRMSRVEARHTSPDSTNVEKLPETNGPIFTRTINNEAIINLFKPPASPVPNQFVVPKLPQWPSSGFHSRGSHRGKYATRLPSGRMVYKSQMVFRNRMK